LETQRVFAAFDRVDASGDASAAVRRREGTQGRRKACRGRADASCRPRGLPTRMRKRDAAPRRCCSAHCVPPEPYA